MLCTNTQELMVTCFAAKHIDRSEVSVFDNMAVACFSVWYRGVQTENMVTTYSPRLVKNAKSDKKSEHEQKFSCDSAYTTVRSASVRDTQDTQA